MGIVRSEERTKAELDEFRRMLMASAGFHRRKDHLNGAADLDDDRAERGGLVCVTSGLSFLGLTIVNKLLARGYSVRIIVDNPGNQPDQFAIFSSNLWKFRNFIIIILVLSLRSCSYCWCSLVFEIFILFYFLSIDDKMVWV